MFLICRFRITLAAEHNESSFRSSASMRRLPSGELDVRMVNFPNAEVANVNGSLSKTHNTGNNVNIIKSTLNHIVAVWC